MSELTYRTEFERFAFGGIDEQLLVPSCAFGDYL